MTRELLILRHGKSDWSTGEDDFDRPLVDRGKRGAQRMGVWLATNNMIPIVNSNISSVFFQIFYLGCKVSFFIWIFQH